MKKEEIYVVIDSEEKRLRALYILKRAGEKVFKHSIINVKYRNAMSISFEEKWGICGTINKTEITLDQLEQLLMPMSELDQLKQQANALGYDLVEKKREPKIGDFGVFWDAHHEELIFGTLEYIDNAGNYYPLHGYFAGNPWQNFRHLTEEEKQQIQKNW